MEQPRRLAAVEVGPNTLADVQGGLVFGTCRENVADAGYLGSAALAVAGILQPRKRVGRMAAAAAGSAALGLSADPIAAKVCGQ